MSFEHKYVYFMKDHDCWKQSAVLIWLGQKHDALSLVCVCMYKYIMLLFLILSCLHIDDFDLFPWQARRDLNDPENAIIGAFAGNMTFNC